MTGIPVVGSQQMFPGQQGTFTLHRAASIQKMKMELFFIFVTHLTPMGLAGIRAMKIIFFLYLSLKSRKKDVRERL